MTRAAKLWLEFSRAEDHTTLRVKQQEIPWRVVRGFRTASGETLAHLHNVSGGILDTDDLHLRVDVQRAAWAQVTSTGATRVYRSRSAEHCGRTRIDARVAEDGFLEYLPDALIPYAGARYEQAVSIQLAPGAALIWWEVVSPGREASGEAFRYERLRASLEIVSGGRPIIEEHWDLEPKARPPDSAVRLGEFRHFASLYVCRSGMPGNYWRAVEGELARAAAGAGIPDALLWGATLLSADGMVLRGMARNGRLLMGSLTGLWRIAKLSLCGRVATLPRKIH